MQRPCFNPDWHEHLLFVIAKCVHWTSHPCHKWWLNSGISLSCMQQVHQVYSTALISFYSESWNSRRLRGSSAEKQPAETAYQWRHLCRIATSTVNSRSHSRHHPVVLFTLANSQLRPRRLTSYAVRKWELPSLDMFEEENFIYNTQTLAASQRQSFQSINSIYQVGGSRSLSSSFTLLICQWEALQCSNKPSLKLIFLTTNWLRPRWPFTNLIISVCWCDCSLIYIIFTVQWGIAKFTCTTVKVNVGLLVAVLINGIPQCGWKIIR